MGNTSSLFMCCLNKSHGRDDDDLAGGDHVRQPRKQYNNHEFDQKGTKSRQYCFLFAGSYDDPDFGWDGDDDEEDNTIDEEMGIYGSNDLNNQSTKQQERKGKYPGDYCQWIEEPNYGALQYGESEQLASTSTNPSMKGSRSVKSLSQNLDLRSNKLSPNQLHNDSIITINNDGFRANIMREDQKNGIKKQDENYFVSFDSGAPHQYTPDSKQIEEKDQQASSQKDQSKQSTEDKSSQDADGQDQSPQLSPKIPNNLSIPDQITEAPTIIEKPKQERPRFVTELGEDLTKWLWEGPEDSDEEIEELLQYKNQYEKQVGIKFSKNGIVSFIEEQLELESPHNKKNPKIAKLWEKSLSTQGVSLYIKKGGSKFSKDQPYIRTESTFNKKFKFDRLLKVVYDPEVIEKWDDTVGLNTSTPVGDRKFHTITFGYTVHKKQYSFQSRDFIDKSFTFYHNGKFYRYTSSLPEDQGKIMKPLPEDTTRGFNFFNIGTYERDPADGKIKGKFSGQFDFKIPIPPFMLNTFLPNTTKNWYTNITKYYMKNMK